MKTENLVVIQQGNQEQIDRWNEWADEHVSEWEFISKIVDCDEEGKPTDRVYGHLFEIKGLNAAQVANEFRSFVKEPIKIRRRNKVIEL